MAFVRAVVEIKPAAIGTGVKVSLKKLRTAPAKMTLFISSATAKLFDWGKGDKIDLMIGTGADHGLIRARKNNSVGQVEVRERKALHGSSFFTLSLGHQSAFVDAAQAALWCQWERVEGGYIEVVLPKWADLTGPAKRPAPSAAATAKPQPRNASSVTASLMGDPEPGRREAVAKMGA